jgi:4-hydroxy-tetrahydrodipicolinate reductase
VSAAPLLVALVGGGKMGRAIAALARERGVQIAAVLGRADAITARALAGADVAVEFTEPGSAAANARACVAPGARWSSAPPAGSTRSPRWPPRSKPRAGACCGPRTSRGRERDARGGGRRRARAARRGFDAHLVETHHSAKKDAPSGTALALASAAGAEWGGEIATTSVRVGHVPGTHALVFDAPFEQVCLTHEARDRRVFAEGALVAARWLAARREPGVYTMQDVLAPGAGGGR